MEMDIEKEKFMVFENMGEDWSQESNPITLDRAIEFRDMMKKRNPNKCYKILTVVD